LLNLLRSWRHGFWLRVSETLAWSRGTYRETPARELSNTNAAESSRIAELKSRYGVAFESHLCESTSLRNYEYLDLLDRAFESWVRQPESGGELLDVGSASFWYGASLEAFFKPEILTGLEIEGHRLFKNGHSRLDYARGYVGQLKNAQFVVGDFLGWRQPVKRITAFFPFLTPTAILAWRLPLSLLKPERFFEQVRESLKPGGSFLMVNHGPAEAKLAKERCVAANLAFIGDWSEPGALSAYRSKPPVLSLWERH
jgi:hypothetical protein